jgi:hypothetical protein
MYNGSFNDRFFTCFYLFKISVSGTNKELEQWILSYLGIEEMTNPYTISRNTIFPLQISKLVPDSILHSFDDIQNTIYDMKKRGLLQKVEVRYGTGGSLEYEEEETPFQITVDGIIQFRKYIRPIARLVINHEEQYQTIVDKTEGDPKVKAELKKVPGKIKDKIEDKAIDALLDGIKICGYQAAIFLVKLFGEH